MKKRRRKTKKKTNTPVFKEKLEKAYLYLALSMNSSKIVQDASERLGQKIKGIFATAATLVPIIAGLGYFTLREGYTNEIFFFIMSSLICLFIAIAVGFWLHGPGDFRYMDASVIFKKHKDKSLTFLINKSASTLADITVHNSSVLNSKEKWVKFMLVFIFLGLLLVVIAFVILGMTILN